MKLELEENPRRRRKNRRSRRRNSWFEKTIARGHIRAAKKGWKHRKKSRNPHGRRRRHNPAGSLGRTFSVGTLTSGFSVSKMTEAGLVIGGAVSNAFISGQAARFLPSVLTTGPGGYVTGLASAGLLGGIARMAAPKWAGPIFLGGIVEVVARLVKDLKPGMKLLGDYLMEKQYVAARPLGQMNDFLVAKQVDSARALGETIMDEEAAMAGGWDGDGGY